MTKNQNNAKCACPPDAAADDHPPYTHPKSAAAVEILPVLSPVPSASLSILLRVTQIRKGRSTWPNAVVVDYHHHPIEEE